MATNVMSNETHTDDVLSNANDRSSKDQGDYGAPFMYVSQETLATSHYITTVVLGTPVTLFGLIGNVLGIASIKRELRFRHLSIYIYLMSLLAFHWLYLLLNLVVILPEFISPFDKDAGFYLAWKSKLTRVYLDGVLNFVSSSILIAVSLERLWSLTKPFTFRSSTISKYPYTITISSFAFSMLFHIPFLTGLTTVTYTNAANESDFYLTGTHAGGNVFTVTFVIQTSILFYIAPVTVVILNLALPLVYSKIRRTQELQLHIAHYRKQFKITMIVVATAGLYLLLSVPNMFAQTLSLLNKDYSVDGKYRQVALLSVDLGNFLAALNASLAVVVYLLVSKKFRGHLKYILIGDCFGRNRHECNANISQVQTQSSVP